MSAQALAHVLLVAANVLAVIALMYVLGRRDDR